MNSIGLEHTFVFSYETGRVFHELDLSFISGATEFLFRVQSTD